MSLSQKHFGKVLVPWFSLAEWKAVYGLIYEDCFRNWPKALQILHIWKLRTPLLSAGVEGTLILLEALLADQNKLSSFEITHIFATSLVRFLNLCAANSERQGTFYKTARQNELPRWLINLRHEIAHNHHVPSQSMLELSLKYCLDWLKPKYWNIQSESMSDFIVSETESEELCRILSMYIDLTTSESVADEQLLQSVYKLVKNNIKRELNADEIIDHLGHILKQMLRKNPREASNTLSTLLINKDVLLDVDTEVDVSEITKLPDTLLRKWNNLINIIHETELMPYFVSNLFKFTYNETEDVLYRKAASFWIKEIFIVLLKKENNSQKDQDSLLFSSSNLCMKDKKILLEILHNVTPFTLHFVKEVLEYNDAPTSFIEDSISLISAFSTSSKTEKDVIFSVGDLNLETSDTSQGSLVKIEKQSSSRWILIEDVSPYINLPLGVLPHQYRSVNPLLEMK